MILLWSKISNDCRFILYGVYLSEEECECKMMVSSDITLPLSFYFYRSKINKNKSVFLLSATHFIGMFFHCASVIHRLFLFLKTATLPPTPLMVTCKILIVLFPEAKLIETQKKISNMSNSYKQNQFSWKILCPRHILRWMQTRSHSLVVPPLFSLWMDPA